jgi:predicted nucleic acid-binding protein
MYLFDTDAITNILKKSPSKNLVKRLKSVSKRESFISTITLGEIIYGAFKSKNKENHLKNLKTVLLPMINILSFDSRAAFFFGRIRAELESEGNIIPHADIQIAAIAIARNLVLITGNTGHFVRIPGLEVQDWINKV